MPSGIDPVSSLKLRSTVVMLAVMKLPLTLLGWMLPVRRLLLSSLFFFFLNDQEKRENE